MNGNSYVNYRIICLKVKAFAIKMIEYFKSRLSKLISSYQLFTPKKQHRKESRITC